jgi:hypothetical protein
MPVLGLDPAEQQVFRAAGAEDEGFDARDLHAWSSAFAKSVRQKREGVKPAPA